MAIAYQTKEVSAVDENRPETIEPVEKIDAATIEQMKDEPADGRTGDQYTRFFAVARTVELDTEGPISIPMTVVLYVDSGATYGFERRFPVANGWEYLPRSVVVRRGTPHNELLDSHKATAEESVALYDGVELDEDMAVDWRSRR